MKPNRKKAISLRWDGNHDALNAGFHVELECGHTFWRPTNILASRGIRTSLEANGAACPQCGISDLIKSKA
jgi:hypothetical protein